MSAHIDCSTRIEEFIEYLRTEKHKSENTLIAYKRDLASFEIFLEEHSSKPLESCRESDAVAYVLELENENKSKATINRKISSIRLFYEYLKGQEIYKDANPFRKIHTARNDRRQVEFLTVDEVTKLMEVPDESFKGLRDRALLEFMYGTGARVTETVRLKFRDINFRMNFVTLQDGTGESRIVPLGSYAMKALLRYCDEAYGALTGDGRTPSGDDVVFINFRGSMLTRQGVWKILKEYGDAIGAKDRMTPVILRNSFAVHILQNGGDLRTLQDLMGFDDMSVGIAYLSAIHVRVKDVYNRTHPRA